MNNEEFLKRLSEVAEWIRPQTGPNGHPSVAKGKNYKPPEHPGPITEDELDSMTETEVKVYYDRLMAWRESQPNDSVPPEIVRLKSAIHKCQDCDRILEEPRRIEFKQHESGTKHWRERCANCSCFRNPITKEFSVESKTAHQFFTDYHRPKKGIYNSKYQQVKPVVTPTMTKREIIQRIEQAGEWITTETEDSITRVFQPKTPGE